MIGRTLSHYNVTAAIGAGGMGEVYLATDTELGREVALKVLPEAMASNPDRLERFRREARAIAALNHPNIVTIHSVEEAEGVHFITMEYVDGDTLSSEIVKGGMSVDKFLEVAIPLADGLSSAHAKGIAHRDLKPANIMRDVNGRIKILDFGLAKLFETNSETDKTIAGPDSVTGDHIVGTIAYMSPEQVEGLPIDARSDVFSLGLVLYETATGIRPFQRQTNVSTISAILKDDAPSVSDLRPRLPRDLGRIIGRCLAKDRERRYQSALDVRNELEDLQSRIKGGRAVAAGPSTDRPAIVVLPFANQSPDPDNEYFSDGLTEEIIADLSKIRALSVISRTSSMHLKGKSKDVRTIGRELGVRYVLDGSVRKAGNSLRITAQLIDATTDEQLWAEKYNATMDNVFDVQEQLSREIVGALDVTLSHDEEKRLADHPIANVRAFELYLQARQEIRRLGTSTERGLQLLKQAIEIEGETTPLLALSAWAKLGQVKAGLNRDAEPIDEAEAQGHSLLALAPESPYGHAILGYVGYERGRLAEGVQHFLKALEREPNDADTLFYLGITYIAAGRNEQAAETAKRLLACDPLSTPAWLLDGVAPWFVGGFEAGLDSLRRALEMDPEHFMVHWSIGYAYTGAGQLASAAKHASWLRKAAPGVPYTGQLHGLLDALNGQKKRAMEWLEPIDATPLDAHNKFHLAESFSMAGATDRALDLLERAVDEGFYPYPYIADHCAFLSPLRATPRFPGILAKAKRQTEDYERRVGL